MAKRKQRSPYGHIPALAGLPDEEQQRLYKRAYREVGWSWQLAAMMALWFACYVGTLKLVNVVFGSRINPGLPRVLITGLLIVGLLYGFRIIWRWFDCSVVAPRVWRHLEHLCTGCGYNLTGNQSGICPECGAAQEVEGVAAATRGVRFRRFWTGERIVLAVIAMVTVTIWVLVLINSF